MFNIFGTNKIQSQLADFDVKFKDFQRELKIIREDLEKIDIKAMEAQRSYRAKLKRITGDEDKTESETNKNPSVFLSPNGAPI